MSYTNRLRAVKLKIKRLKKAKQSPMSRPVDIVNLINAQEKLRELLLEAESTVLEIKNKA